MNLEQTHKLREPVQALLQEASRINSYKPQKYWYSLSMATYDVEEILAAMDSLCSFRTTMWEKTGEFERQFAHAAGCSEAIMVNSGSSADLLIAFALVNPQIKSLNPGDEILVPSVTWPTQLWSAMMAGLKVRFVDTDPNSLNMDLKELEAKIAGIRLAQALHQQYGMNVISPMPCNVYGPGDHFEFERSHVISAMVRRFVEAKWQHSPQVTIWGTGSARREFLHIDDLADACFFLLREYESPEIINVGSGEDFSIRELSKIVARIVGYDGHIIWDAIKPDGMPRKVLDVSKLHALGWKYKINFEDGLRAVVSDFEQRYGVQRSVK
ncbi:aminotransferase class I/II-fold pyridoxal phosphate-dependent enzyme [bacterium]|nr:MAG: aminotransferase class I/II-fold pyridoxal phosphate-dependent enzyme [bacterium]